MTTRFLALGALIAALPSLAAANSVTETCQAYDTPEVCDCATKALMETLSLKEFAYYAVAAGHALEHQEAGLSLVEAWDAARDTHATAARVDDREAMEQMNAYGKAHREAIAGCKN